MRFVLIRKYYPRKFYFTPPLPPLLPCVKFEISNYIHLKNFNNLEYQIINHFLSASFYLNDKS